MGLLNLLLGKKKEIDFTPNLRKSEYDNWLNFVEKGGTSDEWEKLKQENNWHFPKSKVEIFEEYLVESKDISDAYFELMEKIQKNWSVLYNSKDYFGPLAVEIEQDCIKDIAYYEKMLKINKKYKQSTATNIPAFRRLAMLYERQGKYEESIEVCRKACSFKMDERARMERMIKKAGRQPTTEEIKIISSTL